MQVRIEDVSPVEKKLIVSVPWETVSIKLGDAYKELSKGVQLKGFRKGKVPRPVLEQMFGPRVKAEVAVQLVRESFLSATSEHNLDAVAEPRVESLEQIKKGQPFSFEAIVEVRGVVEAKDHDGMELTRRPLKVADEAVDRAIEELRKENTEFRPIEGRTTLGETDVAVLSINGTIGDNKIERPQFTVDLEDKQRDPLPGMIAALVGLPLDTKDHEIVLDLPSEGAEPELAGKQARLTISVVDARAKDVPALDDELAKDTGKGSTLDELKATIRKDLEAQQTEEIKRETRDAALKELVKRNQIPVANSLVERAIEFQWNRLRSMLGMRDAQSAKPTPEIRENMRDSAADEVRGQLLLEAIAEKEGVQVGEAEVDAQIATVAKARNTPPQRLRAEYDRDGRLDGIRFQLRQEKTLDLLIGRASVTEVEPPPPAEGEQAAAAAHDHSAHAHDHAAHAHADSGHVHGPDCDHDHK
jgi:trigger factor